MGNGWEDLSVGSRIASKLVGNELPWWAPLVFQDLAKEALSGSPVSVACDQNIQDVAVLVHRSPKMMTCNSEQVVNWPVDAKKSFAPELLI